MIGWNQSTMFLSILRKTTNCDVAMCLEESCAHGASESVLFKPMYPDLRDLDVEDTGKVYGVKHGRLVTVCMRKT